MVFRHAGNQQVQKNSQIVNNVRSVVAGVGIFVFTSMAMGIDLILSTSLVTSQNDAQLPADFMDRFSYLSFNWTGSNGGWSVFLAWMFSISTTGLQYALWEGKHSKSRTWTRLLAWFIAIADTLTDLGGANVLLSGDPQAADNFFPPTENADLYLWFAVILLSVVCLLHEPALSLFLGIEQGKANSGLGAHWGAKAEAGFIVLAGWLFSIVRIVTVNVGAVGLMTFDFFLTPQNVSQTLPSGSFWFLSFFMFGVQMGVWRYLARLRHNDVKIKDAMLDNDSGRKKFAPIAAVAIAGLAIIIDTGFDTSGYNTSMYGTGGLIIEEPTLAWWLMISMVAVVCLANEPLTEELFIGGGLNSSMMASVTQRGQALRGAMGGGAPGPVTPASPPQSATPAPGGAPTGIPGMPTMPTPSNPAVPRPQPPVGGGGTTPPASPAMPWLPGGKPPGSS